MPHAPPDRRRACAAELGPAPRAGGSARRAGRAGGRRRAPALAAAARRTGADLLLLDAALDVGWLIERWRPSASPAGRRLRPQRRAAAAVRAIQAGAKEFLPLPPDAELIAAMLAAVAGESR